MTTYKLPPQVQAPPGRGLALLALVRDPDTAPRWEVWDYCPLPPQGRLSQADIERAADALRMTSPEALGPDWKGPRTALMLGLLRPLRGGIGAAHDGAAHGGAAHGGAAHGEFVIPGRDDPEYDQVIGGAEKGLRCGARAPAV